MLKNKTLLTLVLFVIGVIVYYGLLVVPPRITGGNVMTFVVYMTAAIYLLLRKDRNSDDKRNTQPKK